MALSRPGAGFDSPIGKIIILIFLYLFFFVDFDEFFIFENFTFTVKTSMISLQIKYYCYIAQLIWKLTTFFHVDEVSIQSIQLLHFYISPATYQIWLRPRGSDNHLLKLFVDLGYCPMWHARKNYVDYYLVKFALFL